MIDYIPKNIGQKLTIDDVEQDKVYRNLYLVRDLNGLEEKDFDRFTDGKFDLLKQLLASHNKKYAGKKIKTYNIDDDEDDDEDDDDDLQVEEDSEDEEESDEDSEYEYYEEEEHIPRGKRFENKDAKKQRKEEAKEAKREKRQNKMKKHLKKKLVNKTKHKKA